nr:retrotransposable element Tf2 [Tanacetum cinerariifolium]
MVNTQIREEFRTRSRPLDSGGNPPPVTIPTWLERFNKKKPHLFEKATAPVDAKNWISHMEKIFDVMGCEDAFKTRLAVYKFEGNALAWWKAYKQAKGGDVWLITVTWVVFKELFFLQFFPRAEQDPAGTTEEQAKNFQWGLRRSTLNHLMCIPFTDVAQVANAARNYEILHKRDDDDAKRPDKREIWTILENLDEQTEFRLEEDDVLWQGTRLCVPNDASLREALLTEAHSSPFSVHPGSTKMYHDLKQHFWWSGMKRDVATFVSRCLICLQVKIEHQRASGLLKPLDILVWKWDEISMDFVTGLPRTQRRHDAIWVVVDRLTKSAHFLPIRKDYSISKLAETFQQEIVRLHGTPSEIVSDRDPCFASRFWKEWTGNWDDDICLVEFAYNNSWHATIKCAPFEMLY